MRKYFWQLIKDAFVYGLGKSFLVPLALITMPIFTRVFVPAEYGTIELIATITSLLSLFLILGMDSAVMRSYFDSPSREHKRAVISTGFWFLVAWGLLMLGIMLLCSRWISSLAFGTTQHEDLLRIVFIVAFLSLLVGYCQNTLRLHLSPWKFTTVALLQGILTVTLSILFVLKVKMGLLGYFAGILIGTAIPLIPALCFIKRDLAFIFSSARIKEMLSYGFPLLPASLAFYILGMADRFFLVKFVTLEDVGLYSVAVKVSSIMLFFHKALSMSWGPLSIKIYSEEGEYKHKELIARVFKYILILFGFLAVLLTSFSWEILHILTTEQYFGAVIAIAPLSLGIAAYASIQVTAAGISISRKTKYIALFSGIAAMVNLGLNALLIPHWGILGASIATAISYTILTLSYYRTSQKLYPIDFDKLVILKICSICLLFVVAGRFMIFDNLILGIFLKLAFILLFVPILFLIKIFDPQEITYIKQWLLGLKRVRCINDLRALLRNQTGGKS